MNTRILPGPAMASVVALALGSLAPAATWADAASPAASAAITPAAPPPPAAPAPEPAPTPAAPATVSPPSPAPAPPPPATHSNTAAFVTGGLAIAAAGAGAVFGVIALGDKSDFQKNPTYDKATAGNDNAAYCDAALGAALVLATTSVILFLMHDDPPPATAGHAPTLTASPMVTPHGAGGGAILRF